MADFDLRIRIAAQDAASRVLQGLTGTVTKLGAAIALYFTGKGIGGFFSSAVQEAAAVEKEFQNLQSKTGAVGDELAALKKRADELGASDKLNVTTVEAAQAMTELGAAGQSTSQILASIEPVITLAQGAQLGLADAAGIVTSTLAQFGLAAEESGRVADVLTLGANSARTTVTQLADALSYAGLSAKESGMTLEETVAIISMMQQAGVESSRAGTALNSMLLDLKNPASSASKELDSLGITTRDLGEIISITETKGAAFRDSLAVAFGKEAAPGFLAAVEAGSEKLKGLEKEFSTTEDASGKAAETMNKGLSAAFESLISVWDALKKSLGDAFLGPVEAEVRSLSETIAEFAKSRAFETIKTALVTLADVAAKNFHALVSNMDFTIIGDTVADFSKRATEELQRFADTAQTNMRVVWESMKTGGAAITLLALSFITGVATIKSVFYGLGGVIDVVIAGAIKGFASLIEAQTRLTFGPLKAWIDERVSELRSVAQSFDDTSTDNFKKAGQAIDDAADQARRTRSAWDDLKKTYSGIAPAVKDASNELTNYGDKQTSTAQKSADLIQAEKELASITREYQLALQNSIASGVDAGSTIKLYSQQVADAQAKVDALTKGQQATTASIETSTVAQTKATASTAAFAGAQQTAVEAQKKYQDALKSGADNAEELGRAWQAAAANAKTLQSASTATAPAVAATGSATKSAAKAAKEAAKSSEDLSSAYQTANAASRAYNEAMRSGSDDIESLKQSWIDAEKTLRDLQATQRSATSQTDEQSAAWDDATRALVTYGEWVTKSGAAAQQQIEQQRAMATAVGVSGDTVHELAMAYAEAQRQAALGLIPQQDVESARKALESAKQGLEEFKAELSKQTQPAEVKIETVGTEAAKAEIEELAQPTESTHTVDTNAPEILSEIDALNGHNTSSTHTVYVQRVEKNATGGEVGRFARGVSVRFPVPSWSTVPGSGDKDSVPASLPAGAFVLRKAATKYYGSSLLDLIGRFASGGRVPALLTPGERVFNPGVVNRLGVGFFDALNRLSIPREALTVGRFAGGGSVGSTPDTVNINLQVGARSVALSGARDQAASLASALRELQRGL